MPYIFDRILVCMACLILLGCRDEFIFESGDPEPVLVVEGHFVSGSEVAFRLRESAPAFSGARLDQKINGAVARLYINDVLFGSVPQNSDGYYVQKVPLKSGDKVELVIRKDEYPLVTCRDQMPTEIDVLSVDSTRTIGQTLGMRMRFRDPVGMNFYELHVNVLIHEYTDFDGEQPTDSVLVSIPARFSSANKIFFSENNLLRTIPGFHFFSDQFIDDEIYDLDIGVNLDMSDSEKILSKPRAVVLNFRNVTESHFTTLSGLLLNNGVYGGPFSHASNVEDNVAGGLGFMQYYWDQTDTLLLIP
ncbi:MAG: DUF4249 family protein [Flavobacteriales bacterium]|nr:DUF4249 family protein [Flavobacteriales bacterium]